jgi:hypothetical protein
VLLSLGEGYEGPTLPVWAAISNGRPLVTPVGGLAACKEAFDPYYRETWQVREGVAAEVLYPTFASLAVETAKDPETAASAAATYNRWARQFKPPHFWPLQLVPAIDADLLIEEIEYAHSLQALGVLLPNKPTQGSWRDFEPAFAVAARLGLPVHWHAFSRPSQASFGRHPLQLAWEAFRPAQDVLVELLCEGILARHPGLKVVFAESDYQWVGPAMERLCRYRERYGVLAGLRGGGEWERVMESQVFFAVQHGADIAGAEGLWGCDFPHADAVEVERDRGTVARLNDKAVEVYPRIGEALGMTDATKEGQG